MSADAAIGKLTAFVDRRVQDVAAFRATVSSVAAGLVLVKRLGATVADAEGSARVAGFTLAANDEVLVIPVAGKPVIVGKLQRATPGSYALDNGLVIDAGGITVTAGGFTVTAGAVALPAASINNRMLDAGYVLLEWESQQTPDVANTSSLSVYSSACSKAVTLPAGTWDILMVGGGIFVSNGAGNGVAIQLSNATIQASGSALTATQGLDNTHMVAVGTLTGLSGSETFFTAYHAHVGGTASTFLPWFLVFGRRTA